MIRRPPRSTLDRSSAASDVYKRQPVGRAVPRGGRHVRTHPPADRPDRARGRRARRATVAMTARLAPRDLALILVVVGRGGSRGGAVPWALAALPPFSLAARGCLFAARRARTGGARRAPSGW